ncbi:hypothetical protein BH24DEI2_BH24DEI2_06380 [soil metagenome]
MTRTLDKRGFFSFRFFGRPLELQSPYTLPNPFTVPGPTQPALFPTLKSPKVSPKAVGTVWISVLLYGSLLAALYLTWYVVRGRSASGVGEARPSLAKAGEAFAGLVGIFYIAGLVGVFVGWGAMGAEEIIGTSLVFAVGDYLKQLTLFLKGRRATTNTGQA